GELIPLGELNTKLDKVATDKEVIVHCRTDGRSRRAVQELKSKLKSDNFYVLKGGVIAYADEIDPKLQKY
nr:molybdenum cofactor biosynthesis protein MoeB [candidate division Zixibacteria bacterium]NIT57551.1 molybdenum cofactor biosynthesis protein MoeB [Fodinibius sp.]NIU14379.1 molybdenum cofactor biosynthesis protein MoeB [candidate division Zixibacteria bacterium]NIV06442.1 molybdenum cofactor biosynthesis protein MoeB [candidate division Zixibacteria bacterium]NIY26133.1 molybdenum cofactor biosynthesis protein MoeB [Fodinibius sp.]